MAQLVFCVAGNAETGIGHLMRCLALAQEAEVQGVDSVFVVDDAAKALCLSRHDWCGRLVGVTQDEQARLAAVHKESAQAHTIAVVVDGYTFSEGFIHSLCDGETPVVLLDDIMQPGFERVALICNPAGEHLHSAYQQANPTALLCLGSRYRLLRREFSVTMPLPIVQRVSLTINMGGSDPVGLTVPLLKAIADALPEAPIRVVTGPGYQQLEALQTVIASSQSAIQHVHNCQDMADLWSNARLAIAAAGGSQFELAACLTPSVLLVVADNQINATQQAATQGWCESWDARDKPNFTALVSRIVSLWENDAELATMHQKAQAHAETQGALELLSCIARLEPANVS